MKWLEQLRNASLIEPLGWAILHSLWQGTAISIITAILLWMARSRSAQLRYVIACTAMFSVLIAAVATFIELRPAKVLPTEMTHAPVHLVAPTVQPIQTTEPIPVIHVVAPSLTDRIRPILPSLALAWIAGVALLGAYHAGGWMLLRRLRFQSRTIADLSSRAMLTDLIAAMRINRSVQLCESVLVQVPTVIGWLSPIILLPASAIIGLSPSELRGLLAHELAHIRRHDYLVNLLQTVIETLLFYHPATWWLGKVIRQERENCCDDLAAAVCDRTIYAQALATMESLRQSPQLALSAKGSALLPRIRRVLGLPTSPKRSVSSGIVSASILAAVIAGGILLNACRSNAKASTANSNPPTTRSDIVYSDPTASDLIAPPNDPYRIAQSDVLNVVINDLQAKGTQSTETKRVNNDGDISLPMIGFVHAAGKTESEFEKAIATKYQDAKYLNPAVVSVTVVEGRGRTFSIRGCVNQPGQYEIPKADLRLNDVIALARGINAPATTLYVIRGKSTTQTEQRIIRIPVALLHSDPGHYNVVILPDDLVQVTPDEPGKLPPGAASPESGSADAKTSGETDISSATLADLQSTLRALDLQRQNDKSKLDAATKTFDKTSYDVSLELETLKALDQQRDVVAKQIAAKSDQSHTATAQPNDAVSNPTTAPIANEVTQVQVSQMNSRLESARAELQNAISEASTDDQKINELQQLIVQRQDSLAKVEDELAEAKGNSGAVAPPTSRPAIREMGEYYVSGVPRAGVYGLGRSKQITVLQALVAAGMEQWTVNQKLTVIHKNGSRSEFKMSDVMNEPVGQTPVQPDDVLMVTDLPEGEYYVGGEDIPRVGVYSLTGHQINVLQALISAGADPALFGDDVVEIRHRVADDKMKIDRVSMKELLDDPSKNEHLEPNDQLMVHRPSTTRPTTKP